MKILTKKILYLNIFAKGYAPNWLEQVFVVSGIKNAVPWTYAVTVLNGEKITGSFCEKELQNTNQVNSELKRLKKYLKEKVISCMSKGKGMIIVLIVGLVKKISCKNESILS